MKSFRSTLSRMRQAAGGRISLRLWLALTLAALVALAALLASVLMGVPRPGGITESPADTTGAAARGWPGTPCTVTAGAGPNGAISPSGAVDVPWRGSRDFSIAPDAGYRIDDVLVDDQSIGAVSRYGFYEVTANHTIAAAFALDTREEAVVVAAADSRDISGAAYVCDGTDDQVQIQAAVNRAGASGGRALLLEGTFRISGTINLCQDLTLEGCGHGTLLYLEDYSNCSVIGNAGGQAAPRANVTIRDLRIDGNGARQSTGHGILRTGDGAVYENLWVANCADRGISHGHGDYTRIAGCTVEDCAGRGILLEQSSWGRITGNRVCRCGTVPDSPEDKAIEVYAGGDNTIACNLIDGGGAMRQIGAWDSPRAQIRDNTLINGLGMGIAPRSGQALIMGNTVVDAGNNAIDTCGADGNWIEGNTISRVSSAPLGPANIENSGICVNGSRSTVIGNRIELCGRAGVHIGPGNNDNHVLDNLIRNCGQQGAGGAGIWVQVWTAGGSISGTVIRGNTAFDDQAVKTQGYGVWLDPGRGYIDNPVVEDNDLRGNGIGGLRIHPASRVRNAAIGGNAVQTAWYNPP